MHKNKAKGTRFEHDFKHVLQMLSFYCIRAYSSMGVADLVFTPPWNPKGNYRPLLVQCKHQESKDYVRPFERDHLNYLQQTNSGLVIIAYKDKSQVMVRYWENRERLTIEDFLLKEYGIPIESYSKVLRGFQSWRRPIHLYPPPKDENNKIISSFADLLSVDVWFPHVPEHYRDKH